MRLCGWIVLSTLVASQALAQEPDNLTKRLAELRAQTLKCDDLSDDLWKALGLKPLNQAIGEAAKSQEPVATLQREYSLPEPAARHLLAGRVELCGTREIDAALLAQQEASKQYALAAREAPGNLAVLCALLSLAWSGDPDLDTRVLQALELAPDPALTALELSRAGLPLYRWRAPLLAFAVNRKPELLPKALELLGMNASGRDEKPFYFEAFQRSLGQKPPPPFLPALANRTIRGLISSEMPYLALEMLRALPEDMRNLILSDNELRLTFAAEYLLEGQHAEARKLLASFKPSAATLAASQDNAPPWKHCSSHLQNKALAFHLENDRSFDPFEIAVELELCADSRDLPWLLLLAPMLPPRYTDTARHFLTASAKSLERGPGLVNYSEPMAALYPIALPRLHAAQKDEAARVRAALASLAAPQTKSSADDAVSRSIASMLESPLPALFQELPLPKAITPAHVTPRSKPDVKGLKVPEGFWPVRVERQRKRVLLIALSQALDPAGEVSGGAYWLLESTDAGKTWGAPLYLGLREYRPYVIVPSSALPMLKGDVLQLEVQVRQLDEHSITFPPIELKTTRSASGLYVEAKLSELRRDSDGDGLPDLVEARLLIDPKSADTDGDGIPDGEDPLPQISSSGAATSSEAEVLSEFFATLDPQAEPQAQVVGVVEDAENPLRLPKGSAPLGVDGVTFVIADRARFQGVKLRSRTLILTPAEYEKAKSLFGAFYPLEIDSLILNEAQDKVFLRYNEHWRGGSFMGEKKDGRWQLVTESSWIT